MKQILLHIILYSYAIVMFKPAFPYVKDAVNHLIFYKQHMATVHFENGKYHVHAEVTKNAKEDNSNKSVPSSKKENTSTEHIFFTDKKNEVVAISCCKKFRIISAHHLAKGNSQHNYPPPRI